jgi:flagellar motor switch protein FliM
MDKFLSQDEINALFSVMSTDDASLAGTSDGSRVSKNYSSYDFHRADRISQEQIRSLHLLHDHFGRSYSSSLAAYLRAFVEANLVTLDQISYTEFLKRLPDPTLFTSIAMPPLEGNLAIELNPSLVFPIIDMLLGGLGRPLGGERNLTEIEINVIEGVIKLAMRDLKEAWHPIMDIDFTLESKGTKPQMFQIVSPVETVIAVGLEIKVGDNSGMMNIAIPSRILKLIRNKFDQQWTIRRQKTTGSESEKILDLIRLAPLTLSTEMRDSKLAVTDLLDVSAGDVVKLNEQLGDMLVLCVAGIPKFRGRIVVRRGKRAFEVAEKIAT